LGDLKTTQSRVTQEALSGRLPILGGERVYTGYLPFLWTCVAFSAATWAFLIGSYLPYIGNTVAGIAGYATGMILGMVPVTLAAGFSSYRFGVETLDAAKAAFGRWGIVVPMIGLVATLAGWTYVVVALTARGAGNVFEQVRGSKETAPESVVVVVALVVIALVWLIASKGPWLFERISNYIAPGHMVITVLMLGILLAKFGGTDLFSINVPAADAFTQDKSLGFAYAVEFGVANSLTWWPVMGGLTRLVRKKNHIMGPSVIGVGILGAAFISAVAAFAGAAYGTADPTIWMIQLGGRVFGSLIMTFVLLANIATMVIMIYLAGVSVQHIKALARLRWDLVIGLLLLPAIFFGFHTEWLLSKVIQWLTYNGVMFVGITGITLVDYFILRRQKLDVPGLFSRNKNGPYWFWGGVNWVAVAVALGSIAFYLWLYNPITLEVQPVFQYFGAGLPTMVLSAIVYWATMRLVVIPAGKGDYGTQAAASPETLPEREAALNVGL
jgi:purine-cytosine permease-like protein